MNDSLNNPEKTQRRPGERVEHWDHRQNAGAIRAPESNVKKNSEDELKQTHEEPAEGIAGGRTLVEAMIKEESAGIARATGGKVKWQGDGTENSLVYIKFLHST